MSKAWSSVSHVFDSTSIVLHSAAALRAFAHQMAHHGFLLHSPGLPPTSTGVVLQTFNHNTLLDWMPLLPQSSCGPKVSKRSIFADLLNNIHFLGLPTNLQNSEDLQSPPLAQLCTTTHPWLICQKAVRLACWLAEQGLA